MDDEIKSLPDPPAGLKEASLRGRLIPFIGAGVSMLAGCPNWSDFADGTLRFFIEKAKFTHNQLDQLRNLSPKAKLTIARALERQHNLSISFEKILYPSDRINDENGRRIYGALSQLAKTFVTTNYDRWLDEVNASAPILAPQSDPKQSTVPEKRTVIYKVEELTPDSLDVSGNVIHLHGSLIDPSKMIMTTQDYVRHYRNDRLVAGRSENIVLSFLESLFENHTVLFVGYGLDELEILEYVISKARHRQSEPEKVERHYLLQGFYSHEIELMRSLRLYYRESGIELIPFLRDHKNWEQLIEVLEKFAMLAPASEAMKSEKLLEMKGWLDG